MGLPAGLTALQQARESAPNRNSSLLSTQISCMPALQLAY